MEHSGASSGFFGTIAAALEHSGFGLMIRDAVLVYPIANVVHVLAVMVFFASVAVMDARVLGFLRGEPVEVVFARWRRIAMLAFGFLLVTGLILFTPEATATFRNPSFQIKLVLIVTGLANVGLMSIALKRYDPIMANTPAFARTSAALSLLVWLGVAACGRFIAYV